MLMTSSHSEALFFPKELLVDKLKLLDYEKEFCKRK